MSLAVKHFLGALSSVLSIMASLSAINAVQTGNRIMYIQAIVFGLLGAGIMLVMLSKL